MLCVLLNNDRIFSPSIPKWQQKFSSRPQFKHTCPARWVFQLQITKFQPGYFKISRGNIPYQNKRRSTGYSIAVSCMKWVYSCIRMVRDCFPFLPHHTTTKSIPFVRSGTQWVMSFKRTKGISLGSAVIRGFCVTGIDVTWLVIIALSGTCSMQFIFWLTTKGTAAGGSI